MMMKMHVQIHNLEDEHGWGAGTSTLNITSEELALPVDEFVERYLKPAFVNAKQYFEAMKEENKCTEA